MSARPALYITLMLAFSFANLSSQQFEPEITANTARWSGQIGDAFELGPHKGRSFSRFYVQKIYDFVNIIVVSYTKSFSNIWCGSHEWVKLIYLDVLFKIPSLDFSIKVIITFFSKLASKFFSIASMAWVVFLLLL